MQVMSDAAKKELHELVDALPVSEVRAAHRYLEFLSQQADPVQVALDNAPYDDEDPQWDEVEAAEGRVDAAAGRTISTDELKRAMADLFSVTAPLLIRHPDGVQRKLRMTWSDEHQPVRLSRSSAPPLSTG